MKMDVSLQSPAKAAAHPVEVTIIMSTTKGPQYLRREGDRSLLEMPAHPTL
jgi:hypothetical protein